METKSPYIGWAKATIKERMKQQTEKKNHHNTIYKRHTTGKQVLGNGTNRPCNTQNSSNQAT